MTEKKDEAPPKAAGPIDPDDLWAALDLDAEGWKPEPGAKLVGTVMYVSEIGSEFGSYPMIAVVTPEGELVNLHCFHTVMRSAVERFAPARGDRIGVKYKGRTTEGGSMGTGYEDYNVIVQKGDTFRTGLLGTPGELPALMNAQQR